MLKIFILVAKRRKSVAKKSDYAKFEWQNADTFAELVAKTQVTICNQIEGYSNT